MNTFVTYESDYQSVYALANKTLTELYDKNSLVQFSINDVNDFIYTVYYRVGRIDVSIKYVSPAAVYIVDVTDVGTPEISEPHFIHAPISNEFDISEVINLVDKFIGKLDY